MNSDLLLRCGVPTSCDKLEILFPDILGVLPEDPPSPGGFGVGWLECRDEDPPVVNDCRLGGNVWDI